MKKSNKGFTLVEVLVVITIMGLILLFALPEVQRLQARNMDRKYRTYEQSLESSARLFVDSNALDLFGTSENGCADVSFTELKAKSLAKEFLGEPGVSCSNKNTYVHIQRTNNKDTYRVFLNCTKNGEIVYRTDANRVKCDASGDSNKVITLGNFKITMKPDKTGWSKTKNVSINIESSDKLVSNIALNYYVSEDDDGDSLVPGSEGTINFGNNSGVTEVSRSVALADMTGFRYLVINPTNIRDTKGRVYSEKTVSGALKLDNTPPVINSVRMHPDFNGTSIWINFTDQESGIKNFTYIFPDREETRAKPLEGKLNSPTYANLFLSEKFTTTGLNEKIRIRAYDNAGNEKELDDMTIKVYKSRLDVSDAKVKFVDADDNEVTKLEGWHNGPLYIADVSGATEIDGPELKYQVSISVNGEKNKIDFVPGNKIEVFVDNQGPTNVSVNAVSTLGETSKIKEIAGYAMQFNKLNQKGLSIVADNSKIELSLLDDEVNLKECTISYTFSPAGQGGAWLSETFTLNDIQPNKMVQPKGYGRNTFLCVATCTDKDGKEVTYRESFVYRRLN